MNWPSMTPRRVLVCACSLLLFALTGCPNLRPAPVVLAPEGATTGFMELDTEVDGDVHQGVLYVPAGYDPNRAWPLIVYLHGIGESGRDGLTQTQVGLAQEIKFRPGDFPCFVYFPQAPLGWGWTPVTPDGEPSNFHDNGPHVDQGIAYILEHYSIDRNTVGLTGISMGGLGVYGYGADNADLFTALMPISADGNRDDAPALANIPVWVLHGRNDLYVRVNRARTMVDAIVEANGIVRYTEFSDRAHEIWDEAYPDPRTIQWLLRGHKNQEPGLQLIPAPREEPMP